MKPPEIRKLVGRTKVKRVREKDEARKRKGLWKKSKKGLQMTCGNCSAAGHSRRKCPRLQRGRQVLQDVAVSAPQQSEENESVFMPTPKFVASSSQQTSQQSASQVINETPGPSKMSKNSAKETIVAPSSVIFDEDKVDGDIESEDEDTVVGPRVIFEAKTRLQTKKLHQQPIGSRIISLKGDENGVSMPTNLQYSPRKLTWNDKACVTSN